MESIFFYLTVGMSLKRKEIKMNKLMTKIILGIIVLTAVIPQALYSQAPAIEWVNLYGQYAQGRGIQVTPDSGYIACGFIGQVEDKDYYLVRVNSDGDTIWTRRYDFFNAGNEAFYSVDLASDGGYVATGYGDWNGISLKCFILKVNTVGDTVWSRTYTTISQGNSISRTSDGGYIIAGMGWNSGGQKMTLHKIDSAGDVMWTKYCGPYWAWDVQQTTDGGYIVTGSTGGGAGPSDVSLVKTDSVGDTLWTRTFPDGRRGQSVQQTTDGGYIVSGYGTYGNALRPYVVKTDSDGDTLWTRMYTEPGMYCVGSYVRQTLDGGYILALAYEATSILMRTNSEGDMIWMQWLPGYGYNYLHSLEIAPDNGYIVAGYDWPSGSTMKLYLAKTEPDPLNYIAISVPETTYGAPGDTITIPVNTEDLTGEGVLSAEFTLGYDYTIITGVDIDISGTLLAGTDWVCDYNVVQGQISVEMAGADTLAGSGTLINLIFEVSPDVVPGQASMLNFLNFMYNQGIPAVATTDGIFIVIPGDVGAIEGIVTDAENGQPIENAVVTAAGSSLTYCDTTDATGHYFMQEVLPDTYDMRVTAFGYNIFDNTGIVVVENDITTVNFAMLHPEIAVEPMSFTVNVGIDTTFDTTMEIINNGNGPLTFNITYYPGGSERTPDIEIKPVKNRGYCNPCTGNADLAHSYGFAEPIMEELRNTITWNTVAPSPNTSGRSAIGWIGDYVYVFGTQDDPYCAQAWQVSTETWVNSTPPPIGGDNWTGVVVNGELYVVGRYYYVPCTDFYKFTPDGSGTGTWTQLAEYPEPICMLAAAGDETYGIIYTAGGYNGNTGVLNSYKYDIATDIWTSIADLPLPNEICGGVFLLNGKFYVVGGLDPGGWIYADTLYEYEPSTDTWTIKAPMPDYVGFNWSNVTTNGTHIYQVGGGGGYSGWPATNQVQVYDPATDTWSYETSLPQTLGMTSAVYVGADIPYILSTGGLNDSGFTGITFKGTGVIVPWLIVNPTSGTIPAGQPLDINIHFDTHGLTPDSTYSTNILIDNNSANSLVNIPVTLHVISVGVEDPTLHIPKVFALRQNYPNPFNPQTTISYALPKSSKASLKIYNIKGQLVETLVNEFQQAGNYSVVWNAEDISSGIYFYRITAGDFTDTKKCVILK